jgi:hypothetical protein
LKSLLYSRYLTFENLVEDDRLFGTSDPEAIVYWELSRDKDGFNVGVPGSHLGIGLVGETVKLRPLYEHSYTRLHLLRNSEAISAEIVPAIERGDFLRTVALYHGSRRPEMDAPRPVHLEPFMSRIGCHRPLYHEKESTDNVYQRDRA